MFSDIIYQIFILQMANTKFMNAVENAPQLPVILGWNDFFTSGNLIRTIAPKEQTDQCAQKCHYSENKNDSGNASVIVFHGNDPKMAQFPKIRHSDQLYVFFSLESPYSSYSVKFPSENYFNLTMTYRAADNINLHAPYGSLTRVDKNSLKEDMEDMWNEKEVLQKVRLKKKLVLQITSNCSPPSGRQYFAEELEKHINISKYGKCFSHNGSGECNGKCYNREIESHFFYLAFENSVCLQYVTEKFWNALRHLTMPIVLSRAILDGLEIPADSFIAADDFSSAEELAKFLVELQKDEQKYLRFFNWTRFYRKTVGINPAESAICILCKMAHRKLALGSKIVADIHKYWNKNEQCVDNFGVTLLRTGRELQGSEEWEEMEEMDIDDEMDMFQSSNYFPFNLFIIIFILFTALFSLRRKRTRYFRL